MTPTRKTRAELAEETEALRLRLRELECETADKGPPDGPLPDSEDLFELLVRNAFDGISISEYDAVRHTRRLLFCNDRYVEMSGYSREELTAPEHVSWMATAHATQEQLIEQRERLMQRLPVRGTASWNRPDGRQNTYEYRSVSVRKGDKYVIVGIDRDITEQVRVQKALEHSESRLRSLLSAMDDLVFVLDAEGRFTFCNAPADREDLLVSPQEFLGRHYAEVLPPHTVEMLTEALEQTAKGQHAQIEYSLDMPGGTRWFAGKLSPVTTDGGNGAVLVTRDVTEHKARDDTLEQSEETVRALLNASTDGAFLIEPGGQILALNTTAGKYLHARQCELLGRNAFDLFPPKVAEYRREKCERAMTDHRVVRFEDSRAGRSFENNVCPVFDAEGRPSQIAVFARDITERKAAEEALRRHTRELETLASVSDTLVRETNLRSALKEATEHLRAWLGADVGAIFLYNEEMDSFDVASTSGVEPAVVPVFTRISPRKGWTGKVFTMGSPMVIPDVRQAPFAGLADAQTLAGPYRSFVSVPLPGRDGRLGVVELAAAQVGRFEPDCLESLVFLAHGIGMRIERSQYEQRLADSSAALRAALVQVRQATENEQRRLSEALHDVLAQQIVSVRMGIEACSKDAAETCPSMTDSMRELARQLNEAVGTMRDMSFALNPSVVDRIGLDMGLKRLSEEFERESGIPVTVSCDEMPEGTDPEAARAAYQVAREALRNARSHAGATEVSVALRVQKTRAELSVKDNGKGFEAERAQSIGSGMGLYMMEEGARHVGGTFEVRSAVGKGTEIRLTIPLAPRQGGRPAEGAP